MEVSVEDFMAGLTQFRQQIASLDRKTRDCSESPNSEEVRDCVLGFQQANDDYLAKTEEITQHLDAQPEEQGKLAEARETLQKSMASQVDEVLDASEQINKIDLEADPEESCKKLLEGAHQLAEANGRLDEDLTSARTQIARHEGRLSELETECGTDETTEIANRIALEGAIERQTKEDPNRAVSVALVEVDALEEVRREHGPDTGDRLLKTLAQDLRAQMENDQLAARYGGSRFALLFPDSTQDDVIQIVERIRQASQETEFKDRSAAVDVTLSCAVASLKPGESTEDLLARLEETLEQATRYGRNRTFQHSGERASPVVPPELSVETKIVQLEEVAQAGPGANALEAPLASG